MKRYLSVSVFLLLCVFHVFVSFRSSASADSSEENVRWNFVQTLLQNYTGEGIHAGRKPELFPAVPEFVRGLGMPLETVIADDEYCLLGQIHRWCFVEQNLMAVVLGDSFSNVTDYGAGSRLFAFRKCNPEGKSSFQVIWGIHLGDSDSTVREQLEYLTRKNQSMLLSKDTEAAPIHVFLYDFNIMHQYIVRKGDLYFYFMINRKGLLEVIVISRFDVMRAC